MHRDASDTIEEDAAQIRGEEDSYGRRYTLLGLRVLMQGLG